MSREAGLAAQRLGIPWWNNPHPAGSRAAYEWDRGHTIGRREPEAKLVLASTALAKAARAMLDAFGGDVPDWLRSEAEALESALAPFEAEARS